MSVIETIAPQDDMYRHAPGYFSAGRSALDAIKGAVASIPTSRPRPAIERILDLPCGYGRVLRHLRDAFPDAEIVACDILSDAPGFCAEQFGAIPVLSTEDPADIPLEGEFHLIFCGSLFTHLPEWEGFLDLFDRHLAPNGLVVFTVHGRRVADFLRKGETLGLADPLALVTEYERAGFGFQRYPRQQGYGISLSSPAWVTGKLLERPWRLVGYSEMAFASFQDVVSCVKRPIKDIRIGTHGEEL